MEQWNIVCCKCGKFILTEQRQSPGGNIKCIKGSYENGFYDGIKDEFYCKECADTLKLPQ